MSNLYNLKNVVWFGLMVALVAIGGALYFEHVLNYQPCALCYEERIPYYILIAVSVLVLSSNKFIGMPLVFGMALLMLLSSLYGGYHAGIEWGMWEGPDSCTAGADITADVDLLALVQDIKIVPCDFATWRIFGLSFAGLNAVASFIIFETYIVACFIGLMAKRKNDVI